MGKRSFQRFLDTFLTGFTNRRTEYRGYWLFGVLFDPTLDLRIQVAAPLTGGRPIDVAERRAEHLFFEGLSAVHLDPVDVTGAHLTIRTQGEPVDEPVGGSTRRGQTMIFTIESVYKGTPFRAECAHFVAPHDPQLEEASQPPFDEGEGRDA